MPKALKKKQSSSRKSADRLSTVHLDRLIEEATVDCYNESEEVRHPPQSGWLDEWGRLKGG